jgi:hypothetical protein
MAAVKQLAAVCGLSPVRAHRSQTRMRLLQVFLVLLHPTTFTALGQTSQFHGSVPMGTPSSAPPALTLHDAIDRGLKTNLGLLVSLIKVLTIEREYGSGAIEIAQKLADRLGWKLWINY